MTGHSTTVKRFETHLPRSLVRRQQDQAKQARGQHCLRWSIQRRIERQKRLKVS